MLFCPPQEPPKAPQAAPIVTIWVHGSKGHSHLPLPKSTKNLLQFFSDPKDLHKITDFDLQHYPFLRAKALSAIDQQFNLDHFYSFGWSGAITPTARKNAALDLFNALKSLHYAYLEKYHIAPQFIIISHSHGGNVVLHLGEIIDPDGFELRIEKAILLACPVQKHTSHLIKSPIFKRIYSLHSHTDMIQIIDPQGLHDRKKLTRPLLSSRHFDMHPKLIQARIQWKNGPQWIADDYIINITMKKLIKSLNMLNFIKKKRGLLHIEFVLFPFVRHLPAIINQLDIYFGNNNNCPSHKDDDIIIEL